MNAQKGIEKKRKGIYLSKTAHHIRTQKLQIRAQCFT